MKGIPKSKVLEAAQGIDTEAKAARVACTESWQMRRGAALSYLAVMTNDDQLNGLNRIADQLEKMGLANSDNPEIADHLASIILLAFEAGVSLTWQEKVDFFTHVAVAIESNEPEPGADLVAFTLPTDVED